MHFLRLLSVVILLTGFCSVALAQPGPPPDPDVPITGIEILLGLGGALGLKKLLSSKGKSKNH
jgi:hypothetical protein